MVSKLKAMWACLRLAPVSVLLLAMGCNEKMGTDRVADASANRSSGLEQSASEDVVATDSPSANARPDVTAAATEANVNSATPASKPKREPIYVEQANGQELIAAAIKDAQRDHKHVLIEWGGNWCGWCYKLHEVFHHDAEVHPIIHEEFVLVLIDSGANKELMLKYGGADRQYSYPHLTVLDQSGNVLTNQETGSLEEGPKHDPKLVSAFLRKWAPEKVDAEKLLSSALAQASAENKRVFLRVGTPYCGWCTVLANFLQAHRTRLETDFVDVKIDTMRMLKADSALAQFEAKTQGGVPWFVILDSNGKELASSIGDKGNIGYPYQPEEIQHFISVLRDTRQRLSDDDLADLEADLTKFREEREKKAKAPSASAP